ncbi:50S ribosomal protein L18 [Patescibacteria group bacterium]|nr:50S ribosomal protein L18 [Patescibacteria group bacterium]
MKTRTSKRIIRHKRVRARVNGTKDVPRLSVYRSHKHLVVQLINDQESKTLLGLSDASISGKATKSEKAEKLGAEFAKKALDLKIDKVVFDRGGNLYLGRVQKFAEAARKAGLKF